MTDVTVHPTFPAFRAALTPRSGWFAALRRSLDRATMAQSTRRALDELPDNLLRDIGLTRSEIPFVAGALASETRASTAQATRLARGHPMATIRLIL
jgi:uncharacterized protein YjiS (DUF1127 family)